MLIVSAATWPYMSTAVAPLIETKFSFAEMTSPEFTTSTGRNRTSSLPSSHSYRAGVPAANVVTENPSNLPLSVLVTFPERCSCISPVVNISECTPYPPPPPSHSSDAINDGMAPMPVWSVAPSRM